MTQKLHLAERLASFLPSDAFERADFMALSPCKKGYPKQIKIIFNILMRLYHWYPKEYVSFDFATKGGK